MLRFLQISILSGIIITALMWGGEAVLAEDTLSANYIMPGCRSLTDKASDRGYFLSGRCAGKIETLLEAASPLSLCPPAEVTTGQAVRVVIQYIDGHPARLHENFTSLAIEALHKAWPCAR